MRILRQFLALRYPHLTASTQFDLAAKTVAQAVITVRNPVLLDTLRSSSPIRAQRDSLKFTSRSGAHSRTFRQAQGT